MSLRMLFNDAYLSGLMREWPTKPAIHELPAESKLPLIINAEVLDRYVDSCAMPADKVIVIMSGAALHPRAYTTAGDLDPAKVGNWRGRGYSLQLRNINRWYPPLHAMCSAIQGETGYGCYVAGFVSPAGAQGLNHHWDQSSVFVYQVVGRKTWQIWKPVVEEPHRDYLASNAPPGREVVNRLKAAGPDHEFDLRAGQVLVLPRGCMHSPHTRGQEDQSIHLTFVMRERTGHWIGEKLAQAAIRSAPLRRVIPPDRVVDLAAFAEQIDEARTLLVKWLASVDDVALAAELLEAARTEPDVDYV
ncbi:JmjC domain-containing protein [Actinoplanes sp. NPDC051513]|uniref:JmjC domain-containing protein n=1 Tax=Actinoplanes sp. NPDC051513 TaxID=3363908 RepID=UPI0037B119A3